MPQQRKRELTAIEKAQAAADIASNLDRAHAFAVESLSELVRAHDARDVVGYATARRSAELAVQRVRDLANGAITHATDSHDPQVRAKLEQSAALADVAARNLAAAPAAPEPVAPTLRSESALLGMLPPPDVNGPAKIVFDAARAGARSLLLQMPFSDYIALEKILVEFPTHEITVRFRKFKPDTQHELLAVIKDPKNRARARSIEASMPKLAPPPPAFVPTTAPSLIAPPPAFGAPVVNDLSFETAGPSSLLYSGPAPTPTTSAPMSGPSCSSVERAPEPMDIFRVSPSSLDDVQTRTASSPKHEAEKQKEHPKLHEATQLYLQLHANEFWRIIRTHLHGTSWPSASAFFEWGDSSAFVDAVCAAMQDDVMRGAKGGDIDIARIDSLLSIHLLDEIGPMVPIDADGNTLSRGWSPAVGLRVAQLAHVALNPSIVRMTQRYLDALNSRADEAAHGNIKLRAEELIASSPLDRIASKGLVVPGVAHADPHKEMKPKGRTALRPLSVTWEGARSPSLWCWVRTSLGDATREEVSLALFGTTEKAHLLAEAGGLYGLPASLAATFPEAREHAPAAIRKGEVPDDKNDTIARRLATLAGTGEADAIALQQASATPVEKITPAEVLTAIDDTIIQLNGLRSALVPWGLATEIFPVITQMIIKKETLRGGKATDVQAYAAVALGQRERLARLAGNLASSISAAGEMSADRGANNPMRPVLALYARAAASAQLATTCEELIRSAENEQRGLVIKSVQMNQIASMQAMDELHAGPAMSDPPREEDKDERTPIETALDMPKRIKATAPRSSSKAARDLARPYSDTQDRARQLENSLLLGREVDHDELQRVQLRQQENAIEAHMMNLMAQLQLVDDEAAAADKGLAAKIASLGSSKFRSLGDMSRAIRSELVEIRRDLILDQHHAKPKQGDGDGLAPAALDVQALQSALSKAQARFNRISEDKDLTHFVSEAFSVIKSQRLRTAIVNMVAMIGIQFVGGAMAGVIVKALGRGLFAAETTAQIAELSVAARGTVGAAGMATETIVQTAGQVALTGGDPGQILLENALMNLGARGTQSLITHDIAEARAFQKAFAEQAANIEKIEAGAAKQASTLGKVGGAARATGREVLMISGEAVMGMALGALASKVVNTLEGHKAQAGDFGGTDALIQGASVAIGRLVHARVAARRERLAELARNSPEAKALQAYAANLEALAAKLIDHPQAQQALDVLAHQEHLITEEIRIVDELIARPDHGGYSAAELAETRAELAAQLGNAGDAAMLSVKLHLSGLRELAPGTLWSGTREDIAKGVAEIQATRPDAHVQQEGGTTTVRVGGNVIEMHEVAGEAASKEHGETKGNRGAPMDEARTKGEVDNATDRNDARQTSPRKKLTPIQEAELLQWVSEHEKAPPSAPGESAKALEMWKERQHAIRSNYDKVM